MQKIVQKLETRSRSTRTNGPAGWHPVGIASGAAAGALGGAAIGTVLGGPLVAAAAGALCAAIGALFGHTIAENLRPTAEEMYSARSGSRAVLSSAHDRPSEALSVVPSAASAPMRVKPRVGSGSPLAVSGFRFPTRSSHRKPIE